jgi:hypothetical protein
VTPSGATITPNINLANGSGSVNVSGIGTAESGGTIGGSGARASISTWGPLPIFNLVVEFFCEL